MKRIFLTFDIDPDFFFLKNKKFSWQGLEKGIKNLYKKLFKKFNTKIKITWFLRIDEEIECYYGSLDYLYHKYFDIIKFIKSNNGVIGIHPHLVKKLKSGHCTNELNDELNLRQLNKIFNISKNLKLIDPQIVRIGNFHFSQKILDFLIKKKVKIDSSSFPGRKDFLWMNSPKKPFFFESKYAISKKFLDKKKFLIEVPVTTYKVKAEYDKKEFTRYLDLSVKNKLFKKYLKTINFKSNNFICLSHPGNLVKFKNIDHGLLDFDINNYINNLILMMDKIYLHEKKKIIFENFYYFK